MILTASASLLGRQRGFALLLALLLLAALYASVTGIFLAARTELQIGVNQALAIRAARTADAALTTWLADPGRPATATYEIGGGSAVVESIRVARVDSTTELYRVGVRAAVGDGAGPSSGYAVRRLGILLLRSLDGVVREVPGSWREYF